MNDDKNVEIFVKIIMPVAVVLSPIIISSLFLGIIIDLFFLKKNVEEPLFVTFGVILFFAAFMYCLNYCKKELGYFSKKKFDKHLILMIIFPTIIGLVWEFSTYLEAHGSKSMNLNHGYKYKIIKPIYIMGEYDDVKKKKISKDTARAYLNSDRLANRYFTAFQSEVPKGTTVTIIGIAPKAWYLYFNSNYYFVTLDPDVSQGLEVKLPLDRGFEGSLHGLNPEIFSLP